MKILAIESAATAASVAILDGDTCIADMTIQFKKTHSQTILPMIDQICKITETEPESIDAVAVSVGPGSFTGLRIGVATGKGIALAYDRPMIEVSTLLAMAANIPAGSECLICPVMDARRAHVYTGVYEYDDEGNLQEVLPESLLSYEELADSLNSLAEEGKPVIMLGDGLSALESKAGDARRMKDIMQELVAGELILAPENMNYQRAASVAVVAAKMAKEGKLVSSDEVKPDYLRPSQAERMRKSGVVGEE